MDSPVLETIKTKTWVGLDNFLFILSAPRSGSTLLRVLLNKMPNVISPPETYFLEFYRNNRKLDPSKINDRRILADKWINFRNHLNVRNLYDQNAFKDLVVTEARTWSDVFSILVQLYAKDARKTVTENMVICEKTPLHIEFQQELIEVFPNAKIIYLLRDPRDVVASLKTCSWSSSSVKANSYYWCKTADLIQNRQNSVLIKYESLVDSPDHEFAKIGALLGIFINKNVLDSEAPNEERESLDPKNEASYKPIDNSFRDKWRTKLSEPDHELEIIENICFTNMEKFGYRPITGRNQKLHVVLLFQKWMDKQYSRIYRRIV